MHDGDHSNGYEAIAEIFAGGRGINQAGVGSGTVAEWSRSLPAGAAILDLGCGTGLPISEVLMQGGFAVHGIDASPSLVRAFRARFPEIPVECAAVEASDFFGREFDAVVAWGLLFLLDARAQQELIRKAAGCLVRGGRLLFTAPREACSWVDTMTGRISVSLGFEEYRRVLEGSGMVLAGTQLDEGGNHYYEARKGSAVHGSGDT